MLSGQDARLLESLSIAGRATPISSSSGIRRARVRGSGAEFHEYRRYQAGDDPRSIDWTVEARLRQLVVRVSRADGHLALHVLVDTSASMAIGTPTKLAIATKAAAALCYVAVEGRDAAGVATFGERVHTWIRPGTGRPHLSRLFMALAAAAPAGPSSLNHALASYAAVAHAPGLVAVVSDFFDADGCAEGLHALLHRGLIPVVMQVVAAEEIDPPVDGPVELTDIEDGDGAPLLVDESVVARYRERLQQHTDSLRQLCVTHQVPYLRLVTGDSLHQMLLTFRAAGLVGGGPP